MKNLAIAATLIATAIGLAGCAEDQLPGEATHKVVYSPEISAFWNKKFPPIRLEGDQKKFVYGNYDIGGVVCQEFARIDGNYLHEGASHHERCGSVNGYWQSTLITFEKGKGYSVFVPKDDLKGFAKGPHIFDDMLYDEFIAQFMVSAPKSQCNSAPPVDRYCDQVLTNYRVGDYVDKPLPGKREFLKENREYSYYPKEAAKVQADAEKAYIANVLRNQ